MFTRPAVAADGARLPVPQQMLTYFEAHMDKLDSNVLQTDTFLVEDTAYLGLSLFPQHGPLVTRAVTHGVAIEVATIYILQEDRCVVMLVTVGYLSFGEGLAQLRAWSEGNVSAEHCLHCEAGELAGVTCAR